MFCSTSVRRLIGLIQTVTVFFVQFPSFSYVFIDLDIYVLIILEVRDRQSRLIEWYTVHSCTYHQYRNVSFISEKPLYLKWCSSLPIIEHGRVQRFHYKPSIAQVICDDGYQLIGNMKLTCNNSKWSPVKLPYCKIIGKLLHYFLLHVYS